MKSPYEKTLQPKSSWELLRWLYYEPDRIKKYDVGLSWMDRINKILSVYWRWAIIVGMIWIGCIWIIAYFDWITPYLDNFNLDFQTQWNSIPVSWNERFFFLIVNNVIGLLFGLLFGLFFGLMFSFKETQIGLAFGLAFGITNGLAFGLALDSTFDLKNGLVFGVIVSLMAGVIGGVKKNWLFGVAAGGIAGIVGGLIFSVVTGVVVGLIFGILVGLANGLAWGLALGLAVGFTKPLTKSLVIILIWSLSVSLTGGLLGSLIVGLLSFCAKDVTWKFISIAGLGGFLGSIFSLYCSFLRLPNCLIYNTISLFSRKCLSANPYIKDALIWYPIYFLDKSLINQAREEPKEAEEFITFLLENRKWQRPLAMKLRHSALSGKLYNTSLLLQQYDPEADDLSPPVIAEDQPEYQPSERWTQQLLTFKQKMLEALQETNLVLRKDKYKEVVKALRDFRGIHFAESPIWNTFYQDVIPKWEAEAKEQLEELEKATADIIKNPYQAGEALHPEKHASIFLGREDVRQHLEFEIRQAETLPMFLLQGQRRVGKTSVLNFLQMLLGKGYHVIRQDLQAAADMQDVPSWMQSLRRKINQSFRLEEPETWRASDNWLQSWAELSEYLLDVSAKHGKKIILAIDEYEEIHTRQLTKYPEKGGQLLGAIRSFTQHQDRIIFLFAGTHLFNELNYPRWMNFFVQAKRIHIDYLSKDDSIQLLTRPYEGFPLIYSQDLLDKIFNLTQGHPFLLQLIGYEMVKLANLEGFRIVTLDALEYVIREKVLQENVGVFEVFWGQFCEDQTMKTTVKEIILTGHSSEKESLRLLLRHSFIKKLKPGRYQLRVPLFEQWVRKFYIDYF